jgi:hypothetical protein
VIPITDRRIGAGGGRAAAAIIRYHDEDDWRMPTGLKWPQTGNSGLSISNPHGGQTELCNRTGTGAFLLSLRLNRKSCPDTLHSKKQTQVKEKEPQAQNKKSQAQAENSQVKGVTTLK